MGTDLRELQSRLSRRRAFVPNEVEALRAERDELTRRLEGAEREAERYKRRAAFLEWLHRDPNETIH